MKIRGPLVPTAVVTVTVRSPSVAVGSITTLAVSDVSLTHDDVGDRRAAPADGHRWRPDEVGARQRDRDRRAPDA